MKLFLYIVALLFLSACTKQNDAASSSSCCIAPASKTEIVINYNQAIEVYKCTEEVFSMQFVSVEQDSRCPLQAECVWKGTAKIGLSFNKKSTAIIELEKSIIYNWSGADFKISFLKLEPYPITPGAIDINTYKAHLCIERL